MANFFKSIGYILSNMIPPFLLKCLVALVLIDLIYIVVKTIKES